MIDWSVFARQLLLVLVPVLVQRGVLPDYLAGPTTDFLTYLLGVMLVSYVVWLGQRRERLGDKLRDLSRRPEVRQIRVDDPNLAGAAPCAKVTR